MANSPPVEILGQASHPAVVLFHLSRIPAPVGLPKVPFRTDLLPEPLEQQGFVGVEYVSPERNALVSSEVWGHRGFNPRGWDQLVRHDRLLAPQELGR
jgi:hypothetical protein